MNRVIWASLFLILLAIIETSLIASLPRPLSFTPLVLAVAVYTIQYRGSQLGIWWLVGYGLYLDIMYTSLLPTETILYLLIGLATFFVSKRIFTNRSLYGIIGCGLFAYFTSLILHTVILFTRTVHVNSISIWTDTVVFYCWQAMLLVVLLFLIFQAVFQINKISRRPI